ncbi:MAG: RNA-binding protein [Candidatus Thiodiazotropha endolucinida]
MNIYVGNLPWSVKDDELRQLFTEFGEVSSANVIMDKFSGRSRGFGFVEMPDSSAAENAIKALNEKEVGGRNLRVNEAKPREERPQRRSRH